MANSNRNLSGQTRAIENTYDGYEMFGARFPRPYVFTPPYCYEPIPQQPHRFVHPHMSAINYNRSLHLQLEHRADSHERMPIYRQHNVSQLSYTTNASRPYNTDCSNTGQQFELIAESEHRVQEQFHSPIDEIYHQVEAVATGHTPTSLDRQMSGAEALEQALTGLSVSNEQCMKSFEFSSSLTRRIFENQNRSKLEEVKVALEIVIQTPAELEIWMKGVIERVSCLDDQCLCIVMEMVVQMAVIVSSTQYILAKFTTNINDALRERDIGESVIAKCLLKFSESHWKHIIDEQRRNLIYFYAEIYVAIRTRGGCRLICLIATFGKHLSELCDEDNIHDIAKISDSSLICTVGALQVAGACLDENEQGRSLLDTVMTKLNAYAVGHPRISMHVKAKIRKLWGLRQATWNQIPGKSGFSGTIAALPGTSNQVGITDEEQEFMNSEIDKVQPCQVYSDDEEDMSREFEDFLSHVEMIQNVNADACGTHDVHIDPLYENPA